MILDRIVADKLLEVEASKRQIPLHAIRELAESAPGPRDFAGALCGEYVALIAEIKRASPSSGEIRREADPLQVARVYAANGAAAISVLTDWLYFQGGPGCLQAARAGSSVPLLRKDFIVDEYQVYESRALEADAVLLIARILDDARLSSFLMLAASLRMPALVEVHDEGELERALTGGARIIGVNNRNLDDFSIDLATTDELVPRIPSDRIAVSESGHHSRADVERAARAGAKAVLVGQALMQSGNIGAKINELTGVARIEAR